MTDNCEVVIKDCETDIKNEYKRVCVGVARSLVVSPDVEVEVNKTIKDGWYNAIYVENNCITDVRVEDKVTISAPACSPVPAPCGGGSGGSVTISADRGNLLSSTATGLFAGVSVKAGAGVSVTGTGTPAEPITISVDSSTGGGGVTSITAPADGGINATVIGSIVSLSLQPTGVVSGKYGKFTINSKGQIVDIDETSTDGDDVEYVAGNGVEFEVNGPIATINLSQTIPQSFTYVVPGYEVDVDINGRVVRADKIAPPAGLAGTYTIAEIDQIVLGDFGSVIGVTKKDNSNRILEVPAAVTRAFNGSRDEDVLDINLAIPGAISLDIYSSEIKLNSTSTPPYMSMSAISVYINNISVPVYVVASGHAIVTSPTVYGVGTLEVTIRYNDVIRSVSVVRATQEVQNAP